MTSYGFGECVENGLTYSLEVRTLNSRYIEVNVRMPRHLIALEPDMISKVKKTFSRGKVDIFVDLNRDGGQRDLPEVDPDAVSHYARQYNTICKQVADANLEHVSIQSAKPSDFFRLDGVLRSERKPRGEAAAEEFRKPLFTALDAALATAQKARLKEGTALYDHLQELLTSLESEHRHVGAKRDEILNAIHTNYHKKLQALFGTINGSSTTSGHEVSEERIAQEVVLLTDKADIEEEISRLSTHCEEFRKHLEKKDAVGRKLDFLCQEMHREVNTMSNKLIQTDVSKHTLVMKQTIERIRQQVQNIE